MNSSRSRNLLRTISGLIYWCVAGFALASEPRPDLTLYDGTVYVRARIVAISQDRVIIVHAGGVSTVHVDSVPLDLLARGKMEIDARANDQERIIAEQRVIDRTKKTDASRIAAAEAREDRQVEEAGVDTTIEILSVFDLGVIAKSHGGGETGELEIVTKVHQGMRAGTGLASHRMEPYQWTETTTSRRKITLPPLFYVSIPTAGLHPNKRVTLRIWKIGTHTYRDDANKLAAVPMYTTKREDFARVLLVRENPPEKKSPEPASDTKKKKRVSF
jgi:hypothetical protein